MLRNGTYRNLVTVAVLGLSTVAAVWLLHGSHGSLPSPGLVVAEEFRVAPVETGRLSSILVVPGQHVTGGQELARLDTSILEREIAVGEARLHYLSTDTAASTAALKSDGYQTERSFQSDLATARAQLESAATLRAQQAAELIQLREELRRQTEFVKQGLTRRDRLDELALSVRLLEVAEAGWPQREETLKARRDAAEQRLQAWRAQYSAETASSQQQVRTRPLHFRVLEQVEALRVLRARLNGARVIAPASGAVISISARPGDVVRAGEPFLLLNGEGARQIVAYVPERDGRALHPGDTATIRRRRTPGVEHPSKVVRVAQAVTPLPPRFWLSPQLASWGREVILDSPDTHRMDAGESLDVVFQAGVR